MDWCRLSTDFYLDADILRAGEAAEVLFVRCLAYAGAEETGGRIPRGALSRLAPTKTKARVDALLRERLLIDDGSDVLIRSWERWQESLDSESERRRKAREKKARQRAEARQEEELPVPPEPEDDPPLALDVVPGTVPGTEGDESRRRPRHIEVEEEQKTTSSGTRKRATPAPDLFPITPRMAEWGRKNAPRVRNAQAETERFLDYHRAKGNTFKSWEAAWRNWMSKADEYAADRPSSRQTANGPNRNTPWFN